MDVGCLPGCFVGVAVVLIPDCHRSYLNDPTRGLSPGLGAWRFRLWVIPAQEFASAVLFQASGGTEGDESSRPQLVHRTGEVCSLKVGHHTAADLLLAQGVGGSYALFAAQVAAAGAAAAVGVRLLSKVLAPLAAGSSDKPVGLLVASLCTTLVAASAGMAADAIGSL